MNPESYLFLCIELKKMQLVDSKEGSTCCRICLGWYWGWAFCCCCCGGCCCWIGLWTEMGCCCGAGNGACWTEPTRLSGRWDATGKSVGEGRLPLWMIDDATCSRFAWFNADADDENGCDGNCCWGFADSCITNYNKMLAITINNSLVLEFSAIFYCRSSQRFDHHPRQSKSLDVRLI